MTGSPSTDPLQQFTPEVPRFQPSQTIARNSVADDSSTEGSTAPPAPLPQSWDFGRQGSIAAIGSVPVPGGKVPLRSFVIGLALGALAMWLLGMQPSLFGRLWQPAAVAPAASQAADPSNRDVNLPPESNRVGAGQNDQVGVAAAPPRIGAGADMPATAGPDSTASHVAPAEATTPATIKRDPAAPVPPGPFRGSLLVRSEPPGARVFIRDQRVGVTPMVLNNLVIGSRAVRIEADGYEPWSAAVRVVANQQTQVTARLDRATAAARP